MELRVFKGKIHDSNTYVLYDKSYRNAIVVDIGEFEQVAEFLENIDNICGLFITHGHYDHIFCLNEFADRYPGCRIFASDYTMKAIACPRKNFSYYHDCPSITFTSSERIWAISEASVLYVMGQRLFVYETPGHDIGSLSFYIGNYFFTGDALIPNVPVVTKLKGGNKEESKRSLSKIFDNIFDCTIVCPGHLDIFKGENIIMSDMRSMYL